MKPARKIILFCALLCVSSDVFAKRKPLNPRRAKAKRSAAVARAQEPPPIIEIIKSGSWDPAVRSALEKLVMEKGRLSPGFNPELPPAVVIPWSDAAIQGDLGEAVFVRMVEKADFKFDESFWRAVPVLYGRLRLRADYEHFSSEPVSTWARQGSHQMFRRNFIGGYREMCRRVSRKDCRAWLVELLWGFKEEELREYAKTVIREELQRPQDTETVRASAKDPRAVVLRRGLRAVSEMKDLTAVLLKEGFDVWVVSDDAQWFLEEMVKEYGIDPSRAVGVRAKVDAGKILSLVLDPVPFRGGKVDAMVSNLGREPVLIMGTEPWDVEILGYGQGLRVLLDKGDPALRALAQEKGWLLQPAFAGTLPAQAGPDESD